MNDGKTWGFWANDHQKAPEGDWHSWLFLGGRGAGKTRAGAEWLAALAGRGVRCALIGASLHDVREVMIEGPSGLKTIAPKGNRPSYEVSRKRLRWPDGGVAYAYSAEDPESLRGPQFHYAWADEFCAWRHPAETLNAAVSATDQVIGTGDGAATAFQLAKVYGSVTRDIAKPVDGTVKVAVDGAEVGFTADEATGVVTLAETPGAGAVVTAGFEFDTPVRFDSERIDLTLEGVDAGRLTAVSLVEIRV